MDSATLDKAKLYQKKRQQLTLAHLFFRPVELVVFAASGLSAQASGIAMTSFSQAYVSLLVFYLMYSAFIMALEFPFSLYSGHYVEKTFSLTNQNLFQWLGDYLKKNALSIGFSALLMSGLYFLIWNRPDDWWVLAWASFAAVSYGIGRLFPVLIVPMFYKYSPVPEGEVRELIVKLAGRFRMPLSNVYSINLSKTTKKANAAFMGMGKTKRVVLSDTLLENFTPQEIEGVVAHELGHYKHGDIWKHLGLGLAVSFAGFWVVFKAIGPLSAQFGFDGAADIAALPLISLLFYVFNLVLMPVQNGFSRAIETDADRFAYETLKKGDVYAGALQKLAAVNLSDPEPNPVYEWFFYDHPAIGRRVRFIRALEKAEK